MSVNRQTDNGKVHRRTGHQRPEVEQRYSSTLSLTSALDGGEWSTPGPGCFNPGKKTRRPLYTRMGGPQGWYGWVRKIWPPLEFYPRTAQPVASRYPGDTKMCVCN